MSGLIKYLIPFVIGILCCWVFMYSCNKKDLQSLQNTIESLSGKNDSIAAMSRSVAIKNDSLIKDKKKGDSLYKHTVDSQKVVINKLEKKIKITWDSIGSLYTQVRQLYVDHDTIALIQAYNDLGIQLSEAQQQIKEMKLARDSADNIRDMEINRLQGVIDQLQGQVTELRELLTECTKNAAELAKNGLKAVKKAKISTLISKIGIGLSSVLAVLLLIHK